MARELNPRQQRFVGEYLKTANATLAYALAGYQNTTAESRQNAASRLLGHVGVKREINRRKRAMLKRSDITIEKLLSDADAARELAMRIDQPAAATSAVQLQAKLVGLLVDRKESGAPGEFAGLTTPDQVIDAIRLELGEAAANALRALLNPPPAPVVADEPSQPPTPTATGSGAIN
jgi:hypothetical protein